MSSVLANAVEPPVTTTYLEMSSPAQLRARRAADRGFAVREVATRDWQLNRSLYFEVGGPWRWFDKRSWSEDEWRAYVERDALRTFLGEQAGALAGYFELQREEDDVEIAYFGLLPAFIGRGLGGPLLTSAIEEAWRWGASRVWVHTCTLDHPAALQNYEARGMRIYATSTEMLPQNSA